MKQKIRGDRRLSQLPKTAPEAGREGGPGRNRWVGCFYSDKPRRGGIGVTLWPAPPECHPRGLPQFLLRQNRRIGRTAPHRRVSRSNAESTSSMIKRKFGDYLRSKTDVAMVNESLCKVTLSCSFTKCTNWNRTD